MQDLIRELLNKVGENPDREGLKKTPLRVEKALEFLTNIAAMLAELGLNNELLADKIEEERETREKQQR